MRQQNERKLLPVCHQVLRANWKVGDEREAGASMLPPPPPPAARRDYTIRVKNKQPQFTLILENQQ